MDYVGTLVHLSDLHFGELDPATGNAKLTVSEQRFACTYRLAQGLLGHQGRSLEQLESYCDALKANGETLSFIVTGDLTRCGALAEFPIANSYLTQTIDLRPPTGLLSGLGLGVLPPRVPGNHDHWGGQNSPASPRASAFQSSLSATPALPFVQQVPLAGGAEVLTYLFVDSDAEVPPRSFKRFFAHGDFISQLQKLDKLLGARLPHELRVLVIHHAIHPTGHTLRMTGRSRRALQVFLQKHRVRFVLSGHTHHPNVHQVSRDCWELCSGSASQIDSPQVGWLNIRGVAPSVAFEPNALLVHRIYRQSNSLWWRSAIAVRSSIRTGFSELPPRLLRAL